MSRMDNAPHDFITSHSDDELKKLLSFKHRTFNDTDLLYFIAFLHHHYSQHKSLETAFTKWGNTVEEMLIGFHHYFFFIGTCTAKNKKTYCHTGTQFHL